MRKPVRFAHKGGRTMKGGAVLPGMSGTIGTAGAEWSGTSLSGPYSSATGQPIADPYSSQAGGRRRRHRKTRGRKSRGRKGRRTMRGGAAQYLPAKASAGFSGAGSRGLADYSDVSGSAPRANDVVPLSG